MSLVPQNVVFSEIWGKLGITTNKVLKLEKVTKDVWSEAFSQVYKLCIAHPESYFDKLYDEIKQLITNLVDELHREISGCSDENILSVYDKHWKIYSEGSLYLDQIFSYMNIQHVQRKKFTDAEQKYGQLGLNMNDHHLEIGELCYCVWKSRMIAVLQTRLASVLLACIEADRHGKDPLVCHDTIRRVILSFVEVCAYKISAESPIGRSRFGLYEEILERSLLQHTQEFYAKESAQLLETHALSAYMIKVILRKEEEQRRCIKFLPATCHSKVEACMHKEMVSEHVALIVKEAERVVGEQRETDMRNMYTLLKPVPGALEPLISALQSHVTREGMQSVHGLQGENMVTNYVENLLEVHRKYEEIVKNVFCNDQKFQEAHFKAFECVVNKKTGPKTMPKSPELIAKYSDLLLKKSNKGLTESEIDDKLSNTIVVFKYLEDKDIFQKFYARHLARRLIQKTSVSMELEECMITKLKSACGYEYTSKLHRMFTDISVSENHNTKFAEYLGKNDINIDTNFNISILQAGAWPLGSQYNISMSLPTVLEAPLQHFENFYKSTFNGRKLTWLHVLSTGEVKCSFTSRTYTITMLAYQVVILMHFQNTNSLKLAELRSLTNLPAESLPKFVLSLVDTKLLLCPDKDLTDESCIDLNLSYSNKRIKFKIAGAQMREQAKEAAVETAVTEASVEEDRKLYIQATIVRVMKSRKTINHAELMSEVISQSKSRFNPQMNLIKKCIELLLDKNYIERSKENKDSYSYVA